MRAEHLLIVMLPARAERPEEVVFEESKHECAKRDALVLGYGGSGERGSIAAGMTDEGKFPQLVEQVEEAISREHTIRCARRDVFLTGSGGR